MRRPAAVTGMNLHSRGEVGALARRDCGRVFLWAKVRDFEAKAIGWWSTVATPCREKKGIF